jgi:hypothetical protein
MNANGGDSIRWRIGRTKDASSVGSEGEGRSRASSVVSADAIAGMIGISRASHVPEECYLARGAAAS